MQNVGFGFMHCLDEIGDLEDYERNGILRNLLDLKAQERDYSVIATLTPKDTKGTCVYCKHCHPCPAGLDIGLINRGPAGSASSLRAAVCYMDGQM